MAKQGMKRPERTHTHKKNEQPPVPEIYGKAKHGNVHANSIIATTSSPSLKVYHRTPHSKERPIPSVYAEIDNDLARDNIENDITAADLQDL